MNDGLDHEDTMMVVLHLPERYLAVLTAAATLALVDLAEPEDEDMAARMRQALLGTLIAGGGVEALGEIIEGIGNLMDEAIQRLDDN